MAVLRAGATVVLAGLLAAGCGIPTQDRPTPVPGAALPQEAPPDDSAPGGPAQHAVEVYLVGSDALLPVERRVEAVTVEAAVRQLFQGPTGPELEAGVRTAIRPGTTLRSAAVLGGVATVDVARSFFDVTGQEQILAVAQVVFTATALEGVVAVQLAVQGEPIEVPLADGTLIPVPVSRSDYAALQAPAS